jgi:hypothetical protein
VVKILKVLTKKSVGDLNFWARRPYWLLAISSCTHTSRYITSGYAVGLYITCAAKRRRAAAAVAGTATRGHRRQGVGFGVVD